MKRACVRCGKLGCTECTPPAYASSHARRKVTGAKRQRRNRRVLLQHGAICHLCGRPGATEVDHVIPLAEGGSEAWENLRPAHTECNGHKAQQEAQRGKQRAKT